MPNLRVISIKPTYSGVPLPVLRAILGTVQLREFYVDGKLSPGMIGLEDETDSDETDSDEDEVSNQLTSLQDLQVCSLTHFRYRPPGYANEGRISSVDTRLLTAIVTQTRRTIENLFVPSVAASIIATSPSEWVWPRLHTLSLRGARTHSTSDSEESLLSVPGRLPALVILKFELAQPSEWPRQAIGPSGPATLTCPCPNLKILSVSYPHPEDKLYALLPVQLQKLALKCWPRHYTHIVREERQYMAAQGWWSPVLTSSEMLRILEQCYLPQLRELDVEFVADREDPALLRHIARSFPHLRYLHLHRYRDRSGATATDVPVVSSLARNCGVGYMC